MLTQEIIVGLLFLLGIICLTFTFVRFYSNNIKKYKLDSTKKLSEKNTCDSCFAPIMQ